MDTLSPRESTDLSVPPSTYPRISNITKTTRRLLLGALLIGSALSHGCATQEKAKVSDPKTYNYTKPGKVKQVSRKINFCASSRRDIVSEEQRCTSNKKIIKEKGQYCLECDTTGEVIDYN